MDEQGAGQEFKAPPSPVEQNTRNHRLNTDPSLDTVFYSLWAGALGYAVSREGLELSKVSSAGVAAVCGAVVYMQWWKFALQNVRTLSAPYGNVSRYQ